MRIGVVTTSYPRSGGDPSGSFVAAHVAAMRADGHAVDVLGAHSIASHSARRLFDGAGAPDLLERGGLRAYLVAARFSAELTVAIARRASDWDLIVAHWLAPSALSALPARTPLLAIAHGGDIHTLRRLRLLAPALYALRARGAWLAFVSAELRDTARAAAPALAGFIGDALVQPMGIDVARFAALGRSRAVRGDAARGDAARGDDERRDRPTIAVVARLVPIKGVDVAVTAFRSIRTPAQLIVAGDGPERERLVALDRARADARSTCTCRIAGAHARSFASAESDGAGDLACTCACSNTTRFLGAIDTAARDRLLGDAALVVIPSRVLPNGRTEGTPMIALEALAAGVPVVASAVGGLRELPGITRVRPNDPDALAAAIDRVLASPPPRVDVSELDWSRVSARLLAHART